MSIYTYQKNVTTSITPVQCQDQTVELTEQVVVKAALNSDTKHFKLAANEAVECKVSNLNQIWIDSTVSGEGVEIFDRFRSAGQRSTNHPADVGPAPPPNVRMVTNRSNGR